MMRFSNHVLLLATAIVGAVINPECAAADPVPSGGPQYRPFGAATPAPKPVPEGGTRYHNFVAMNDTMTCVEDGHAMPFNFQVRGVNLGGWMVLEPWITPSLFYQFLGRASDVGVDSYTFCEALGAEEANKQLRRHWETWVTEDIVKTLAESGINSIRLPVGDFMYKPYGPYLDGCWDGSLEYVDRFLDM